MAARPSTIYKTWLPLPLWWQPPHPQAAPGWFRLNLFWAGPPLGVDSSFCFCSASSEAGNAWPSPGHSSPALSPRALLTRHQAAKCCPSLHTCRGMAQPQRPRVGAPHTYAQAETHQHTHIHIPRYMQRYPEANICTCTHPDTPRHLNNTHPETCQASQNTYAQIYAETLQNTYIHTLKYMQTPQTHTYVHTSRYMLGTPKYTRYMRG